MDEPDRAGEGVEPDDFKDALARWASTVTVVAVRGEDGKVRATTVTSFAPVSAEPPEVVISLSPGAQVLPFLEVGDAFGVSLLSETQSPWARRFADTFPVGAMPWTEEGVPLIGDALAGLACSVRAIHPTEGRSRLVVARVDEVSLGPPAGPLVYWARAYHRLAEDEG